MIILSSAIEQICTPLQLAETYETRCHQLVGYLCFLASWTCLLTHGFTMRLGLGVQCKMYAIFNFNISQSFWTDPDVHGWFLYLTTFVMISPQLFLELGLSSRRTHIFKTMHFLTK